ncbi:iron chelate uptake ABC transporter family permease subunit [Rothia mucilaginosa]|uniref:FecCD family ABC transporter permease n=1 Tax=Rothia mucilaginosa TaxID=43675 RepID=UPI001C58A629|nr:iron chelate uptake ABC transporter family permease subunit [Rothia mucilaginosa]QXW98308.1 iron chelate uptake ABC transporter family permease subunit [Rothia mucilaginosa]
MSNSSALSMATATTSANRSARRRGRDLGGRPVLTVRGPVSAQVPWRVLILNVALVVLIAALAFWGMLQGDYKIAPEKMIPALLGEGKQITVAFAQQRAARIVAALLVGAALGLSGAIFQVISGNALGSPDIIGFTNGAATGALLQIIVFNSGPVEVALGAVVGGLATSVLVWLLTRRTGLHGFRLVLVGIGVGSTLAAFNSLLVVRASLTQAQTAASWLAGSLNDITWERTYALLGLLLVVTPLLLMLVRPLGAIRFGDQVASGLGVSVNAYRVAALFIGVLLVSLATATTGPIAFVALAAPHIAKTLARSGGVGFTSAALMGALMVLGSDLIGRFAVPGRIIQVGVVTGAIGGLYLIYLIYLERKKS